MREEIQAEKYIIYKNASGGISKYPLPASTGTGDGNIYLTGATDRIIYGIGKNVSGEIEYFEDPLDIVTNFSEVIPSADWVLNPNGHKMTLKMYGIFQALEKGEE